MKYTVKKLEKVQEDLFKTIDEIHELNEEDPKIYKKKMKEINDRLKIANSIIKEADKELIELKRKS